MNKYMYHIGDFNNATRHLSKLERWFYRDMLDRYYDQEEALMGDFDLLCRKLQATDEQERTSVQQVLTEFFHLVDGRYHHHRCDAEIAVYQGLSHQKSIAGKASADARKRLKALSDAASKEVGKKKKQVLTGVEHLSTNEQPATSNQQPISTREKFSLEDKVLAEFIFQSIQKMNPNQKQPNMNKWAGDVRLIREVDKRPIEQIRDVFIWANKDDFWRTNILSPAKLRKQFDNLLIKINNKPKRLLRVPENDNHLMKFAEKNGLQKPYTMTNFQYRKALSQEIAEKKIYEK